MYDTQTFLQFRDYVLKLLIYERDSIRNKYN